MCVIIFSIISVLKYGTAGYGAAYFDNKRWFRKLKSH